MRRQIAPVVERLFARWWYVPLTAALVLALPISALGEVAAGRASERLDATLSQRAEETARRGAVVASARLDELGRIAALTSSEPTVRSALATGTPANVDRPLEATLRALRDLGLTTGIGLSVWFVDPGGRPFGVGTTNEVVPGSGGGGFFRRVPGPAVTDRQSFGAVKASALNRSARVAYAYVARSARSAGPAIEIVAPVQGGLTPFIGALVIEVPSAWFEAALRPHVSDRDDLYLVDGTGVLAARAVEPPLSGIDLSGDAALGQNAAVERADAVAGAARLAASAAVGDTGWRVIAAIDPVPARAELQSTLAVDRGLRIALLAALLALGAVIGRLGTRTVRRRQELVEALERQTATAEILRLIAGSPSDVQPVLDGIASSAARFCAAENVTVALLRDGNLHGAAAHGSLPGQLGRVWLADRGSVTGRSVVDGRTIHVVDLQAESVEEYPTGKAIASEFGHRTVLSTPLLREGVGIGALVLRRDEVRGFTAQQIELVEIFAAQAVIAIENVRLFNETREALERQTAVGEILRVIAGSPTDVQPVVDAIADSAARFCGAENVSVVLQGEDGLLHPSALVGPLSSRVAPFPLSRETVTGRSMLEGQPIHVDDLQAEGDEYPLGSEQARALGYRTTLATPLMRGGHAFGAILLRRAERMAFTAKQIDLVRTFADQAVIAIENVRLFNETTEALEQQTATADVLKVISRSPFQLDTVLETLIERAADLCEADAGSIFRPEADGFRLAASTKSYPDALRAELASRPAVQPGRSSVTGRVLDSGRSTQILDVLADPEYAAHVQSDPVRTLLGVPLLRDAVPIGVMVLRRNTVRPFTDRQVQLVETFADQAVIAIENVRLFNETKEALERQTAVSEILRVIAGSPTDVQPVLNAIADSAARFCGAENVDVVIQREDGLLHPSAHVGPLAAGVPPFPLSRETVTGRSMLEGHPVYVDDLQAEGNEYPLGSEQARAMCHRTTLAAPLMRDGRAFGAILMRRAEVRPFSEHQIELVQIFADQAVIAIENVRLFNETKESLERQTAISAVLATISRSAFDLGAILDTVVQNAVRLCGARGGLIFRRDIDVYRFAAVHGSTPEFAKYFEEGHFPPIRPGRGTLTGRVVVSKQPEHVLDLAADPEYAFGVVNEMEGTRTSLGVPLLHQGEPIGAMSLWRNEVRAFSPAEIELVQTFADQAAIAIENVRLFNETKEALEQQTAMSEVLKTISSSVFDLEAVLRTIASRARVLCDADACSVWRVLDEGRVQRLVREGAVQASIPGEGQPGFSSEIVDRDGPTLAARCTRTLTTLKADDAREHPDLPQTDALARLAVPILRDGEAIGALLLTRLEPRGFSDSDAQLVETFASQAGVAIENVRLFNETKEALDQQTATAEVLRTINRTALDLPATLQAVVLAAGRLCDADFGWLNQLDEHVGEVPGWAPDPTRFVGRWSRVGAYYGRTNDLERRVSDALSRVTPVGDLFPMYRQTATSLAILDRRTVNVRDWTVEPDLQASGFAKAMNARALLIVPMIREGDAIGAIALARSTARAFTEREVALAQTFADQAVIAIENVRLFNEIQEKSSQLEIAGRHKSEFLANMSHELRTPLNAIIGFSEVLLQGMFGELNEKQREYQEDVLSSGRHLLTLINDILDLSKIEAGRVELELGEFSLPAALDNGVTMVRERAARHGIRVTVDIDGVDLIVADERKVKQIVANLLSNAVKFTPDGGRVEVRAAREDGEVRIAIRDTGIGIDEADRERIFEEFQQASRDPERSREGTGLGLALSKRYVELHGGRIWVESEVGQGSTFTFSLPLMAAGKDG